MILGGISQEPAQTGLVLALVWFHPEKELSFVFRRRSEIPYISLNKFREIDIPDFERDREREDFNTTFIRLQGYIKMLK
jgi:hypothetical protein